MKPETELILNFVSENSHVPIWVLNDNDGLIFTTAKKAGLRGTEEVADFLKYFTKSAVEEPSVIAVSGVELFSAFTCGEDEANFIVVVGPAFKFHPVLSHYSKHLSLDYLYDKDIVRMRITELPAMNIDVFCRLLQVVTAAVQGKIYDATNLRTGYSGSVELENVVDKVLTRAIYDIREESAVSIYSYDRERTLINFIRKGDIQNVTERVVYFNENNSVRAPLTAKTKRQFEYEVVSLIAIITRAAVDGGLDGDTAFSLSDMYLQRIDNHRTSGELVEIARHAMVTFAEKVYESKQCALDGWPPRIRSCMKFINAHVHEPITLDSVADHVGLNPKYFSRYFYECTGIKFTNYVRNERIKEACELLKNTDMSCIDIGNSLAFSTQSYFIKTFSELMGVTPQKYRENAERERNFGSDVNSNLR